MVRIRVRSWAMLSVYESPHKDRWAEVCVSVRMCARWSLFSLQPRLLPAKSKVGGGCISTSLHYRERWGGERGGGRWRSHFCNEAGWKRSLLTDRHPHKPAASDTWGSRSAFLRISCPERIVPLLWARHHQNLICYYSRHTYCGAWCTRSQSESQKPNYRFPDS